MDKTEVEALVEGILLRHLRVQPNAYVPNPKTNNMSLSIDSVKESAIAVVAALNPPPSAGDTGEAVAWRYEINHGPDGEQNYAMVYDAKGWLVGNLKTFHAVAVVNAMNAEPASSDAALRGRVAELEAQIERVRDEATRQIGQMGMVGPNWLLETLTRAHTGGTTDE